VYPDICPIQWRTNIERQQVRGQAAKRRGPTIVLYSHDGFGLGHLSRTIFLGQCIRERDPHANILIVTSSPGTRYVSMPEDFEFVKLPSVTKTGVERYRPLLAASLGTVINLRSSLLLTTVQQLQPDCLFVDHRPAGLKGEVLHTLDWIRRFAPHIRTVVGLRDVVDEASTVIAEWKAQGVYDALEHLYDAVLVYGERVVFDVVREYELPDSVSRKLWFTGYLGRGKPRRSREDIRQSLNLGCERLVVVHAGGGGDGDALITAYLQCVKQLPGDVHSLVVTGPLMDRGDRRRLCQHASGLPVKFVEYQPDLASYVAAADLSVSLGGYNTICEVLSAGVRALIVPRIFPRQEQYIRALRLTDRALIELLPPTRLQPDRLAASVRACLGASFAPSQPVSLDGGARAADIVLSLVHARDRSPASLAHSR
jgi:predicted glycosyltransferase